MSSAADHAGPDAAVFDLDGVITFTARVHAAAWKELFDEFLRSRFGEHFVPFDAEADYRAYVDGKPRYDGVQSFLAARGVSLPFGTPFDSPETQTVCGLGNRKNVLFAKAIQKLGVGVDHDAVRLVRELRAGGVRVGLASSSKNALPILERAGLSGLFQAVVDGILSERLGLRGKPQPDIFLKCLELLGRTILPARAVVVEDALAGVQAGRLGGFGLVLGVDRHGQSASLLQHGAHLVIRDFREITAEGVLEYFRTKARVA